MEKLSQVLWRERELLETLLFKLEEEQTLLQSDRTRWLVRAAGEVEKVLETIRATEILRAVAADAAAAALGLGHNPSLRSLVDAVDEPWHSILADHHDAFTSTTSEVVALADANRELIASGYRSARKTLWNPGSSSRFTRPTGSPWRPPRAGIARSTGACEMTGTSSPLNTGRSNGSEPGDLLHKLDQLATRLSDLSAALRSGDQAVISASITALDAERDQIAIIPAEVGSRQNRVGSAIQAASDGEPRLRSGLSNIEDSDLVRTTVDVQMQQVAYQAALAATAKVMQPSLLDFLR